MTHTWLRNHKFLSYAISRHIFRVSLHQVRNQLLKWICTGSAFNSCQKSMRRHIPLTKISDEIKEHRRQGSPFPGRLMTEPILTKWICVDCMIRRKRGRIHAVLTGLLDLPANVQVNHAHAKRGRSCTLSPICISICPELSDGSNSKNAISYICVSMYFLADNAKVGFFLNLFVEVKIFSL